MMCQYGACGAEAVEGTRHCIYHQNRYTTAASTMKCKTSNCEGSSENPSGWCVKCLATPAKPSHYISSKEGLEAIDVIEAFKLGWNLSNALKYILRADRKGQRESDLDKAIAYLWRERYGTWRP